ncbi:hypothetical protein AAHC03_017207 [Spirometra sp. Aus1]
MLNELNVSSLQSQQFIVSVEMDNIRNQLAVVACAKEVGLPTKRGGCPRRPQSASQEFEWDVYRATVDRGCSSLMTVMTVSDSLSILSRPYLGLSEERHEVQTPDPIGQGQAPTGLLDAIPK